MGTGTSVRSPSIAALFRRMKAEIGFSRKSTSPTRMLLASAPLGIFLMKFKLCCGISPFAFPKSPALWFLLIEMLLVLFLKLSGFSAPVIDRILIVYGYRLKNTSKNRQFTATSMLHVTRSK